MEKAPETIIDLLKKDEKILSLFIEHRVLFAYLFGSHATGRSGKTSDIDLALHFSEEKNEQERFEGKLILGSKLASILGKEVEIVVLNDAKNNYLLADILRDGLLIFDRSEDQRFLFETETGHRVIDFLTHSNHVSANSR